MYQWELPRGKQWINNIVNLAQTTVTQTLAFIAQNINLELMVHAPVMETLDPLPNGLLGNTQPLVLGTYPQLLTNYHYYSLALGSFLSCFLTNLCCSFVQVILGLRSHCAHGAHLQIMLISSHDLVDFPTMYLLVGPLDGLRSILKKNCFSWLGVVACPIYNSLLLTCLGSWPEGVRSNPPSALISLTTLYLFTCCRDLLSVRS
jgi:hypothetical protein